MNPGIAENPELDQAALPPMTAIPESEPASAAAPRRLSLRWRVIGARDSVAHYCVPPGLERDTEPYRRARLITGFGILGFIFGCFYASFYLLIGHVWGATIIIACSLGVASVPFILRATHSVKLAGNLLTLILLLGFSGLCGIEGGLRGHAIGWLAAVPLCALLLVEGQEAVGWCVLSVVATAIFVILDLNGIRPPLLYDARWHQLVTAAGYLGLTLFMSVLGLIFEGGRRRAFGRMERALVDVSNANVRLKKLDAEKNEFLGVVAHDLKNPLNIVMGFAEMIATGRGTHERDQEDARYIIEGADRMISLITQLLDINAIEQGRFPLDLTTFDLAIISGQVVTSYMAAAEKKQISLYAAPALVPAIVRADSKAAYSILDNLLSNAVKYSPPGRDVFVRMRTTMDGAVVWEVQDQGSGLTEADQAKLFQKFTKLSARPTGGESSTGLGLSIVKMLAEAMGGTVECKSKHGEGATFFLRLPAAPVPAISTEALAARVEG